MALILHPSLDPKPLSYDSVDFLTAEMGLPPYPMNMGWSCGLLGPKKQQQQQQK